MNANYAALSDHLAKAATALGTAAAELGKLAALTENSLEVRAARSPAAERMRDLGDYSSITFSASRLAEIAKQEKATAAAIVQTAFGMSADPLSEVGKVNHLAPGDRLTLADGFALSNCEYNWMGVIVKTMCQVERSSDRIKITHPEFELEFADLRGMSMTDFVGGGFGKPPIQVETAKKVSHED